jgi:hypothetical protein
MFETTNGFSSFWMSMIRAAPTFLPEPNSSVSSRYSWPLTVNGVAFCGVLTCGHVSRLTIDTVGFVTRS